MNAGPGLTFALSQSLRSAVCMKHGVEEIKNVGIIVCFLCVVLIQVGHFTLSLWDSRFPIFLLGRWSDHHHIEGFFTVFFLCKL